jgi:hypothetical protein
MTWLVMFHLGWLIGAFVLGLGMGWIAVVQRGEGVSIVMARWLSVLVAVLIGLAVAKIVPGRFGYWLDLGLILFGCYLVGCTIGSCLRQWVVSRAMAKPAA